MSGEAPKVEAPKVEAPKVEIVTVTLDALRSELRAVIDEARETSAPVVLTTERAAAALDTSTSTINRLVREGLPHFYLGDQKRFELPVVLDWLRARKLAEAAE